MRVAMPNTLKMEKNDQGKTVGKTLVDVKHVVKNQHDQIVTEFTEKIIFDPQK